VGYAAPLIFANSVTKLMSISFSGIYEINPQLPRSGNLKTCNINDKSHRLFSSLIPEPRINKIYHASTHVFGIRVPENQHSVSIVLARLNYVLNPDNYWPHRVLPGILYQNTAEHTFI